MSLSSSWRSFCSSFTAAPLPSPSATALAERLEKLAWHLEARGQSCCAQQAYSLALEVKSGLWDEWEGGWVVEPRKMGMTKETT